MPELPSPIRHRLRRGVLDRGQGAIRFRPVQRFPGGLFDLTQSLLAGVQALDKARSDASTMIPLPTRSTVVISRFGFQRGIARAAAVLSIATCSPALPFGPLACGIGKGGVEAKGRGHGAEGLNSGSYIFKSWVLNLPSESGVCCLAVWCLSSWAYASPCPTGHFSTWQRST
jgi:hypothetical protein